jgi:hypothetical protein
MESLTKLINILAAIYVALPLVVLVYFLVYRISGREISSEIATKLLEFGKWYMVAVAIVFAAKILDASFADRETSIKEIAIYEKYAATIIETDNVEKRWKLAEYFAAVTPSKPLRDRWLEYKSIIKPEYDTLQALNERERTLKSKGPLSENQKNELLKIQQQKNDINTPFITNPNNIDKFIIVFTADTNLEQAQHENRNLIKAGITDATIMNKGSLFLNISKDYSTRSEASNALNILRQKVREDAYVTLANKFFNN